MLTQLRGNLIDATHELEMDDANVVVINTCGFIDNAKQGSIDTILRYLEAKDEGKVEKVLLRAVRNATDQKSKKSKT